MFPHHWSIRPWLIYSCLLAGLFGAGCTHTQHRNTDPLVKPVKENADGSLQFLVEDGESSGAVYSSDGDRILYISKRWPVHARNQVYEKDLNSGVERRITFQNGNANGPHYLAHDSWIVYASSTDELEENPALLQAPASASSLPLPYQEPLEIYIQALRGFDIVRLTQHQGFDGEAQVSADGSIITFTEVNGQKTQVLQMNRQTKSVHPIKGLGVNPTQFTMSPDGKFRAWIEWDESFGVSRLRLQQGSAPVQEVAADQIVTKTDLSFSPDSRRLFWAEKDPHSEVFDLWTSELAQLCPRRLTTSTGADRRDPVLSPDLRWLTFTVRDKTRSRIARMGFLAPTGACPASP